MIKIGEMTVGLGCKPYIIAEMSGNHNQSLDRALDIVKEAAKSGVNAIKLQTYTADTLTLNVSNEDFIIKNKDSLWHNRTLYELYEEAHTPWEWHNAIFEKANDLGLHCFSTPFDDTAVDFLEGLNVPAYKIASFEITHLPLLAKVASTGKPIIVSTGMATLNEIDESVECLRNNGNEDLILLKCTSSYPASPENSNIKTIPDIRNRYNCEVGLSDHTLGIGVSIAAVANGATVIEKHFTLSRSDGGVDSAFSMEPHEMRQLVKEIERAWQSLGKVSFGTNGEDEKSRIFRQSIYASEDIDKGSRFTKKNLRIVRPGYGLPPKFYDQITGKQSKIKIKKGTAIDWSLIEDV